jgi:hypothetical protein
MGTNHMEHIGNMFFCFFGFFGVSVGNVVGKD